jgi:hypothetical protein
MLSEKGPSSGPTGAADTTRWPLSQSGMGGPGTEETIRFAIGGRWSKSPSADKQLAAK